MDKIMNEVCVFLADGFEEIEGLTVVDLLRRAGIETRTVSIMGQEEIQGAHGIIVKADSLFENTDFSEVKMLVASGGMPGTIHLKEHKGLEELILKHNEEKKSLAAICAAPTVFGGMGILKRKEGNLLSGNGRRTYRSGSYLSAGSDRWTYHNQPGTWNRDRFCTCADQRAAG